MPFPDPLNAAATGAADAVRSAVYAESFSLLAKSGIMAR
jgi:hypothetical protein